MRNYGPSLKLWCQGPLAPQRTSMSHHFNPPEVFIHIILNVLGNTAADKVVRFLAVFHIEIEKEGK